MSSQPRAGQRFWEEVEAGRVVFGHDETTVPRVRTTLFENNTQVMVSVHYSYAQTAPNQFAELFGGSRVFYNPKPVDDLANLVWYLSGPDDLVLDFFAGSGTTGHAVLKQNAKDGGARKYMLVQLPEAIERNSAHGDRTARRVVTVWCRGGSQCFAGVPASLGRAPPL
jgi:adenine-specific DNA-methyltransferase